MEPAQISRTSGQKSRVAETASPTVAHQPSCVQVASGALNVDGSAEVSSVSCAAAGNCSAGGYYRDGANHTQAFVVSGVNRSWKTAIKVPGGGALSTGGYAEIDSVSCAAAGDCSAGGYYVDGSNDGQAFVVNEMNRSWKTAIEVPGSGALDTDGYAGDQLGVVRGGRELQRRRFLPRRLLPLSGARGERGEWELADGARGPRR